MRPTGHYSPNPLTLAHQQTPRPQCLWGEMLSSLHRGGNGLKEAKECCPEPQTTDQSVLLSPWLSHAGLVTFLLWEPGRMAYAIEALSSQHAQGRGG